MKYNERGEELPDDSQSEVKVKFRRPPSIQELIAMHVKAHMQIERKMGQTDEEDFEEDEEPDAIMTPYEIDAYAAEAGAEIRKAEETQKVLDRLASRKQNKGSQPGGKDGFREDEKGIGRVGRSGEADSVAGESGPKVAGSGKESKDGVVNE